MSPLLLVLILLLFFGVPAGHYYCGPYGGGLGLVLVILILFLLLRG
jgi:hypothetical protein